MTEENILEVGIDKEGRLFAKPSKTSFDHIYRAAMEVHWDKEKRRLFGPKPREWSYLQWFNQITDAAADEYGIILKLTPDTVWLNMPDDLKGEIQASSA